MTGMPTTDPKHARMRWTFWQGAVTFALSLATLGTAGPAGFSVYRTSYDFAYPMLGREAWILPVALEAVFMVLFGWGILLAWRKVADVPVRVAGSLAIAALSFAVQIDAAHGAFSAILVRVAIVASFFVASFTMKAAFMRLRGGKVRGDRVSLGEFLASPPRALGLWRWKNAWAEPSASLARQRYMVLLYVIALAQADQRVGRTLFRWRRRLPVTLRYELSTGLLPAAIAAGDDGWQAEAESHVASQLALLPPPPRDATAEAAKNASISATPEATGSATAKAGLVPSAVPREVPRRKPARISKEPEAELARAAYRKSARQGEPLTDRALAEQFGRSRTWGASRIAEVGIGPKLAEQTS